MIHFINDNPFHKWWSIELPISHLWAFNHKYTGSPYRVESNASFIDEGLLRRHWIQKGKSYSCFGEICFMLLSSIGIAEDAVVKSKCLKQSVTKFFIWKSFAMNLFLSPEQQTPPPNFSPLCPVNSIFYAPTPPSENNMASLDDNN